MRLATIFCHDDVGVYSARGHAGPCYQLPVSRLQPREIFGRVVEPIRMVDAQDRVDFSRRRAAG